MDEHIVVPNVYDLPHGQLLDDSFCIPKEIGNLKLSRRESKAEIIYYDWNLRFVNPTFASRPNNFGKDEIQVIFNLNQKIEWQICSGNPDKTFHQENETVKMFPGEVCIFRNNDYKTSMQYDESVNFKFKSLQMKTSYFEELLSRYFPKEQIELCKSIFLTHVTKTLISPDMYHVLSEIDGAEKYHQFKGIFLEAKMMELIALVLNGIFYDRVKISPRENSDAVCRISEHDSEIAKIEALRQRIQFNPSDDYNAAEIAESLSMSESKFTRLFRSIYGVPFHQYVKNQRLEKAASLISQGSMNVSEAASRCGYNNLSHFSKEFQKKFGVLPSKI